MWSNFHPFSKFIPSCNSFHPIWPIVLMWSNFSSIIKSLTYIWQSFFLKSKSCLHPLFGPLFNPPIPSFFLSLSVRGPQKQGSFIKSGVYIMMKWWNSAFNAQGSRVIIVVVQVGTVKIYVAAVEELRKNERQVKNRWNSDCHQKWCNFISEHLMHKVRE
jgi:hypothetical protein